MVLVGLLLSEGGVGSNVNNLTISVNVVTKHSPSVLQVCPCRGLQVRVIIIASLTCILFIDGVPLFALGL